MKSIYGDSVMLDRQIHVVPVSVAGETVGSAGGTVIASGTGDCLHSNTQFVAAGELFISAGVMPGDTVTIVGVGDFIVDWVEDSTHLYVTESTGAGSYKDWSIKSGQKLHEGTVSATATWGDGGQFTSSELDCETNSVIDGHTLYITSGTNSGFSSDFELIDNTHLKTEEIPDFVSPEESQSWEIWGRTSTTEAVDTGNESIYMQDLTDRYGLT